MFDAASPPRLRAALGVVTLVAGLGIAPQLTSPAPASAAADVLLSAVDGNALANSGIALIMGPSMIPTPSQHYAETVDALFLQPRGFAGELEVLTTPASPYNLDASLAEGAQLLVDRVQSLISDGQADADHPVTVFGYSQSAALTTLAMQQLYEAGVPTSAVHFVLIGDSANPNGGLLVSFADMTDIDESLEQGGVTLGNPTPNDLYPTDIYTLEYDGYADFPRYPLNMLSSINAVMGMATQHIAYLGLTPEQLAQAVLLESSPDSMINSYMVPSEYLPILWPLLFVPVFGKPLYDLMEPGMRVLVNLGYGSIDHGWNDGPADVPTGVLVDGPNMDWDEVSEALARATQTGWEAFVADLKDPATFDLFNIPALVDNPALAFLLDAGAGAGIADTDDPTLQDLLGGLTDMMWNSLVGGLFTVPS